MDINIFSKTLRFYLKGPGNGLKLLQVCFIAKRAAEHLPILLSNCDPAKNKDGKL